MAASERAAVRLSEEEREALRKATHHDCGKTQPSEVYAAVENILADRLAAPFRCETHLCGGCKAAKVRDLLTEATARLATVESLLGDQASPKWDGDNYEGRFGGTEHRTTGGRAWCFQCAEWCYPESYACPCCEPRIEPDDLRAALSATPAPGSDEGSEAREG